MGRATQGVKLINLRNNDEIAAVTKVNADIIEQDEDNDEITAEEMITNADGEQILNNNITNIENEDKSEITGNQ